MSLIRRSDKGAPLSASDHDANLKRLEGFADLRSLLADRTEREFYAPGDIIQTRAEGFRYRVAGNDVREAHLETAGGVRLFVLPTDDGLLNFRAFAPAADGRTDDYSRLIRAINALPAGGTLFFPDGTYFIGRTVFFKKAVYLKGTRSGLNGSGSAVLKFPLDTKGLKFERPNTFDGVVVEATTGADGSIVEGLHVLGTRGADKGAHGIHANCRIHVERCRITHFSGDGIRISTHELDENYVANANCSRVTFSQMQQNGGCGLYVRGKNANACYFEALDFGSNGRWGLSDRSFLGNTHVGHHTALNGVAGAGGNASAQQSSFVSFGSKLYSAHPDSTDQQLVDTEPGANADVWVYTREGGPSNYWPLWEHGKAAGTYFSGGAYLLYEPNARNVLLGCYSEDNQASSFILGPSLVLGGLHGAGFSRGGVLGGNSVSGGNNLAGQDFQAVSRSDWRKLNATLGSRRSGSALSWQDMTDDDRSWDMFYRHQQGTWYIQNGGLWDRGAAYITSTATNKQFGTGAPIPYLMGFPILGIGDGNNARRQTNGTSAPTSGAWGKGDIVWNVDPTAGGYAGWICVAAGTPGTWKVFGSIAL